MFETIVVGTDGSPTASEAVRRAAELARLSGAALHLVTAYHSPEAALAVAMASGAAVGTPAVSMMAASEVRGSVERTLDEAEAACAGVTVSRHAATGSAGDVILAVAGEQQADLIVVGNKGMKGARRLLGSVPSKVAHHADCAVMIVHTC